MNKKIIITTGGTGGHIMPGIVLGDKLINEGSDVLFLGDLNLKKYIKNKKTDFVFINSGQNLKGIKSIFKIITGIIKSFFVILKYKPDVVIGFGCYATLPTLISSFILRKKVFLHEQNFHIGKINKFFSSYAKYIFTSFHEIYGLNIKNSNKAEFTGNLIRNEIKNLYDNPYKYPKNNEKFNILIIGGSGGASFFANKFINIFKYIPSNIIKNIKITQQVKSDEELLKAKDFYKMYNIECELKIFYENMPEILKNTNLVISRSGIGMASELAVSGRPTIFIPSPNVANNHQFYNAEFYRKNNACLLVEENNFDEKLVSNIVSELITNQDKLLELSNNIRKFAYLEADNKIFDFIKEEII